MCRKVYHQPIIEVFDRPNHDVIATSDPNRNIEDSGSGEEFEPDYETRCVRQGPTWGLVTLLSLALFSSCISSDEMSDAQLSLQGPQSDLVEMSFRISMDDENTNSRAVFAEQDASGKYHVNWQENDMINVMYANQSGMFKDPFKLDKEKGLKHGIFKGVASLSATKFTALYPYQNSAEYVGSEVKNVVLPTWQTATEGSFDRYAGLLMGEADNPGNPYEIDMYFKHVCSFIELTPTFDCNSIIVSTRSPNEYLSGNFYLGYNEKPEPSNVEVKKTGLVNQVTLRGPIVAGKTYYIAVLPGTYNSGIRVTCVGDNGKMVSKQRSSAVTLQRSKHHKLTAFLADPASAEVDGVDLGTGDGVLWATRNLGATAPQEYGDRYAWGESMPIYSYTSHNSYGVSYKATETGWSDYEPDYYVDVATQNLGGTWRMPTREEMDNLLTKCNWSYTDNYNNTGYAGYTVTSKADGNSNQIFLPIRKGIAYYWTSDFDEDDEDDYNKAYSLELNPSVPKTKVNSVSGYISRFIRPVRNKD